MTIIEKLFAKKKRILTDENIPSFKRSSYKKATEALEENTYPILFGLRRVGKTTILKQLLKKHNDTAIYITFRDSYISSMSKIEFLDLIEELYEKGIRYIFLDEAQINKEWSEIVVEIFDSFQKIKMVVTGSSSLSLEMRETGLDRTRKIYIHTLSFGEYLELTKKKKNKGAFEAFLGSGGFPKYALNNLEDYDIQRSEILDEILTNDIPREYSNVDSGLLTRLLYVLASLTNGEVNVKRVANKVAPNFIERDVLKYIGFLEKANIVKVVKRVNVDGSFPKRRKFKVYINPHIHLWIFDSAFNSLNSRAKGHIVESYWLFWALTINDSSKQFVYIKDKEGNEIDFASFNKTTSGPVFKTLHEFKYSIRDQELSLMKKVEAINKLIWTLDGKDQDGILGKNILDTNKESI